MEGEQCLCLLQTWWWLLDLRVLKTMSLEALTNRRKDKVQVTIPSLRPYKNVASHTISGAAKWCTNPLLKSLKLTACPPSKLTPKQPKVSRHTTDTSSQATIRTVGQVHHVAYLSAWTLSSQTAPSTRALCRKSSTNTCRHDPSNWEAPREAVKDSMLGITQTLPQFSWSELKISQLYISI